MSLPSVTCMSLCRAHAENHPSRLSYRWHRIWHCKTLNFESDLLRQPWGTFPLNAAQLPDGIREGPKPRTANSHETFIRRAFNCMDSWQTAAKFSSQRDMDNSPRGIWPIFQAWICLFVDRSIGHSIDPADHTGEKNLLHEWKQTALLNTVNVHSGCSLLLSRHISLHVINM